MTMTVERQGMPRGGRKSPAEVQAAARDGGDRVTIIFRTEDGVRLRQLAEDRDIPLSIMLRHWVRERLAQEAPETRTEHERVDQLTAEARRHERAEGQQ